MHYNVGMGKAGLLYILLALALVPAPSVAEPMDDEIDYLIGSIGKNGCSFIRNGKRMMSRDARVHLESKRRRNAHLFASTEEFIEKIASASVTSGEAYLVSCRGKEKQPANQWLTTLLAQYRER